jgi:hypothetical protein
MANARASRPAKMHVDPKGPGAKTLEDAEAIHARSRHWKISI